MTTITYEEAIANHSWEERRKQLQDRELRKKEFKPIDVREFINNLENNNKEREEVT